MAIVQIFARPPVEGRVKTRLIEDIGTAKATEIYRYCLAHTLNTVATFTCPFEIWLSESSADSIFEGHRVHLQRGADLGERMLHALEDALLGSVQACGYPILVGSDCLDLNRVHLQQAADALGHNDMVLLPALDGGFALIGCRRFEANLFDNIKWSSQMVLTQLLDNARRLDLRVELLESVRDIDTLSDLKNYAALRNILNTE